MEEQLEILIGALKKIADYPGYLKELAKKEGKSDVVVPGTFFNGEIYKSIASKALDEIGCDMKKAG